MVSNLKIRKTDCMKCNCYY